MTESGGHGVIAVIPARYASTRLPGKPLAEIGGRPMIVRVVEQVRRASLVDEVLVATDDERIATAVRAVGCAAVMTPAHLRSGTDRIAVAVANREEIRLVVNVQGDEPFIPPAMIDAAIQPLLDRADLVAGTLVRRIEDPTEILNPSIPKVVLDQEGFCLFFSRSPIPHVRDAAPAAWLSRTTLYRHIGLYVYRRDFLRTYAALPPTPLEQAEQLEQLRILEHGYRIKATVTDLESFSVDTPGDLARARTMIDGAPA